MIGCWCWLVLVLLNLKIPSIGADISARPLLNYPFSLDRICNFAAPKAISCAYDDSTIYYMSALFLGFAF
jgi:hypothetical protein